jgi:hypothetical protein
MSSPPYAAETPRLYLETLSLAHLSDFHEQWDNDAGVLWSSKPKKNSIQESREWLVEYILPTEENWDIDKYALLLKGERNEEGGVKCIGRIVFIFLFYLQLEKVLMRNRNGRHESMV